MRWQDKLSEFQLAGREALDRLSTVGRVSRQTGLHRALRWSGVRVLAREISKGKQNASLIFRFLAHNDPHRIGLVGTHGSRQAAHDPADGRDVAYSFFEMNDLMDRTGLALLDLGMGRGATALLMLKNRPEFVILQPAIGRIGGAAVSLSWRSTPREIEYIARHSGARALFFDAEVAEVVQSALPLLEALPPERCFTVGGEVQGFPSFEALVRGRQGAAPDMSEDSAVMMYTSGTTGKPKGAVRKYAPGALAGALAVIGETPMRAGDVHLAVCPLYHATAFGFIALSYVLGGSIIVLREFRPEAFLAAVERYRVTSTAVVPTMLHRILELGPDKIRAYDTSSLQAIFSGGAPLPGPLAIELMDVIGDKIYNFYGATETGVVTLASPKDLRTRPGTIGRAIPGVEIRLVDEQGSDCETDQVGELYTRSPMLIEGYHADAQATAQSMRGGFFSVGDLARRDTEGLFYIEGRKRDMIISGGVNVYPAEVEATIETHPAVREVAVVGMPDQEWGERVCAFVALKPGSSAGEDDLKAHCLSQLAKPKVPREIRFIDALPRNPTGKVLKRELRTRAPA